MSEKNEAIRSDKEALNGIVSVLMIKYNSLKQLCNLIGLTPRII